MSGMGGTSDLPRLTWSTFFSTWHVDAGWLLVAAVLAGGYVFLRSRATASTVPPWRVASFLAGVVLMWVCVASAIGAYSMSLFWMHMVLHLLLIMVVPSLLVIGHPLTVLVEGLPDPRAARARRVLRSGPVAFLVNPASGMVIYAATIIGTHLTGFMDQMAEHSWLMTGEQVLYIVAGYLFLLPLLGEEPVRSRPAYLLRMILLVAAMIPDTIVGIVLLQADKDPFPVMMSMHPHWALDPLSDVQTAGGLMWAAGDGLMMLLAVGVMVSAITSPTRREHLTGAWLERARSAALTGRTHEDEDSSSDVPLDPDSDEALEAYNKMLGRLRDHG